MKVSAIVNCSYEGLLLKPTLDSVLRSVAASGFARDCEIIVVADQASETTLDALAGYEPRLSQIVRTRHGDLGMARNEGAAAACGELALFCDGDDLWSGNWIAAAWAEHRASARQVVLHPEFALLFGGDSPKFSRTPTGATATSIRAFWWRAATGFRCAACGARRCWSFPLSAHRRRAWPRDRGLELVRRTDRPRLSPCRRHRRRAFHPSEGDRIACEGGEWV